MVNENRFFLWMEMGNRGQRATLSVSIILGAFNWSSPFSVPKKKIHGNQLGLLGHGILLHLRKLLVGWKVFSFSVLKIRRATLYILYSCLAGYMTDHTCEQHRATLSQSHLLLLLPPMHALLDMSFSVYLHFHNFKLGLCNRFYSIKKNIICNCLHLLPWVQRPNC